MKEKTSITLSPEVLSGIDRIAGSKQSRSAFIEAVLLQYLRDRARARCRMPTWKASTADCATNV